MLDQYRRIKRDHQGEVLFFRLGDFYEMFAEDALEVSSLLNLTLTTRNKLPMCGIPYHAVRSYIARLLRLGKKIAICEQLSEPVKGLMEREVVEIITPGTTVDEDYLEKGSANYLASLSSLPRRLSFAYIDISAGEFYATSFSPEEGAEKLRGELERLQIREMVIQESLLEENSSVAAAILGRPSLVLNRWADWLFDMEKSRRRLEKQFGAPALRGFGLSETSPETLSAGVLLDYLDDTAKSLIPHVRSLRLYHDSEYVGIDESSQRNLELIRNLRDGDSRFSLLEVMDDTRSAMGRRLLKRRILHPLRSLPRIQARLDMVETLYRDQTRLGLLREIILKVPDLERLSSRLAMDKAHGKDMLAIKNALDVYRRAEEQRRALSIQFEAAAEERPAEAYPAAPPGSGGSRAGEAAERRSFERLMTVRELLDRGICEEPSILLSEGGLIRDGYDGKLDELRRLRDNGRQLLEDYLEEERQATGIPSLKIRYNRLIGYFFEVTKIHLSKVPPYFIRRQGIVTGERFTTDRLAALESDINGASDRIAELEKRLFLELREKTKDALAELTGAARRIAELDCAQSLARSATIHGWVRPEVDDSGRLRILEGRHPVVEAHLPRGEYIPNDVILDGAETAPGFSFALITGPNMAGKSTYLRQAALITLMAQAGSFVPAREALIGLCDRIYCRVGASDNLARGESTFLVEMNETAYILNTATKKSLVIMDEVGRGTGTGDGLAIAWAVSEELLNRVRCRTLFATHYHELSRIPHPRLVNRSMEVLNEEGRIVFLRRLREGPSEESYGIHVARLAGLSEAVLERARSILEKIREGTRRLEHFLPSAPAEAYPAEAYPAEAPVPEEAPAAGGLRILTALEGLDPNSITPLEALDLIAEWKTILDRPAPDPPKKAAGIHTTAAGVRTAAVRANPPPRKKPAEDTPSLFD
ncbi:MAG: DNA mismatch repair protein MutS [Treponema sp.]|jgi:DNA mismatch repair protein MutS|nr:DNA mismatch repair protein MutS [Treponema sp.]